MFLPVASTATYVAGLFLEGFQGRIPAEKPQTLKLLAAKVMQTAPLYLLAITTGLTTFGVTVGIMAVVSTITPLVARRNSQEEEEENPTLRFGCEKVQDVLGKFGGIGAVATVLARCIVPAAGIEAAIFTCTSLSVLSFSLIEGIMQVRDN